MSVDCVVLSEAHEEAEVFAVPGTECPTLVWPSNYVAPATSSSISNPVVTIALDFSSVETFGMNVMRGDWQSFDMLLGALPPLSKVVFGFGTREQMTLFISDVIQTKMIHARAIFDCKYAILHHTEDKSSRKFFVSASLEQLASASNSLIIIFFSHWSLIDIQIAVQCYSAKFEVPPNTTRSVLRILT